MHSGGMSGQHWGALALPTIGAAMTVLGGCDKQVDCNEFCKREAECITEISVTLGAATEKRVQSFTEAEVKLLGDKQRQRCLKNCRDEPKPEATDGKWADCLGKSDCKAFSDCVYSGE
jgi:hypothetical protein